MTPLNITTTTPISTTVTTPKARIGNQDPSQKKVFQQLEQQYKTSNYFNLAICVT